MTTVDLIVIGSGPGGYPTAAAAAAQGQNVVLIERSYPGGTCLNRGCIPTKAMVRSAEVAMTATHAADYGVNGCEPTIDYRRVCQHRDDVVQALREGVAMVLQQVRVVEGEARFASMTPVVVEAAGEQFTAPKVIVATGAEPARLPIPGADLALTSDDLLTADRCPESLVIIGGGVIGLEFASVYAALGTKVTVLEFLPEVLPPFDAEVAKRLRMLLKKRGVDIVTGAAATAIRHGEVDYTCKGKQLTVSAEQVLMAVGRRAVVPEGLQCDMVKGCIKVDPATMQTSVEGVYAIGDVNGLCQLAHAATAQGEVVLGRKVSLDVIPAAVFTLPEAAMVGLTEARAREAGYNVRIGKSTFRSNGKALAMGEPDGMVKVVIDADTDRLLGAHILGPHAADLIHELALAMTAALTTADIRATVHAHPTLCEAVLHAL